jgi:hypothetical protein
VVGRGVDAGRQLVAVHTHTAWRGYLRHLAFVSGAPHHGVPGLGIVWRGHHGGHRAGHSAYGIGCLVSCQHGTTKKIAVPAIF